MEPLYIATVSALGARFLDLAIDPVHGATLGIALRMRIAIVGRLRPAIGDTYDRLVVALLVVHLAPRFEEAALVMVITALPLVSGRSRLSRSSHWPRGSMLDLRRNHDRGAPFTAAIIIVVVGASLPHECERQYEESKVK